MKKIYFLLLVLVTLFVACRKDRNVEFTTFEIVDEKFTSSYTSVDLSCKVRCAATINELYLQYDTVADFSTYQEVTLTENEKTKVYSVKIGDLLDNTTYYVRYVAVNSFSQVTSEEISQFQTLQATVPTIEVVGITNVLDTIAFAEIKLVFDGGAEVSKMGICWGLDSIPTIENNYLETENGKCVLNIVGLESNKTYYLCAYAENKIGLAYSVVKSFITLTLPEVKTNEITDIQYTSAVLHGEAIFDGNDTAIVYGFCWSEEENPTIENANIQVLKDAFSYRLSNLLDETKYYVRSYAKNKIGIVYGEEKEFVTQQAKLPIVETNEVTDIKYTSAKVGGNVVSDGGAEVIERGVCYSMSGDPTVKDSKVVVDNGLGEFTITLSDLKKNTKYYVRAFAKNRVGVAYGTKKEFTILIKQYTISVYSVEDLYGTVSGGGTYDEGSQVTITATAKSGYKFTKWNDGNTNNPRIIAVTKDVIYTAHFEKEVTINAGHEYVDLGLSVKWATCNVGATKPEEYGDYFAWGEVESKGYYDWSTYKYCKGSDRTLTKYCDHSSWGYNGFIDDKTILERKDDAAYVNWGGTWRMPTLEEQRELFVYCNWVETTENGVKGYKITSMVDGYTNCSIFLPKAGCIKGSTLTWNDEVGLYWLNSLSSTPSYASNSHLTNVSVGLDCWMSERKLGLAIRPVCP